MKLRNVVTAVIAAGATLAITLAVLWPATLDAEDRAAVQLNAQIAAPVLKVSGCELRLRTVAETYQAGEKIELVLEAVNTTDKPVTLDAKASMAAAAPASRMSRMMILPKSIWEDACPLTLAPGETKTVNLPTEVAAPAGKAVSYSLTVGKTGQTFGSFTVPAPPPEKPAKKAD